MRPTGRLAMASDRLSKSALSFSTNTACAQLATSLDNGRTFRVLPPHTMTLLKPD